MSYYLIGIGGTGARCMEAFIYLNGAGILKDHQDVKLVYVDADVSCGNLVRTQNAMHLYQKVKNLGFGPDTVFTNNIIDAGFWSPVAEGCDTLDDVFQHGALVNKTENQALGSVYEALFSEQERTTDLDKGFRGHPAIGAAVMSEKMDPKSEPWKSLLPQINADKDAKIFLFASVFGGTGAAGFPTIAKLLKEVLHKDNEGNCVARIGGALVLPYFQFPPADDENAREMQAKVEEFMLNTKSALEYYDKNDILGPVFTSIYMVGDNEYSQVETFSLGSNSQENESNIIELYAALAAVDFFNKEEYDRKTTPMIARAREDYIGWNDLPSIGDGIDLQERLANYIRFLYAYKYNVLKSLERIKDDESYEKYVSWYKELVKKQGGIDVYRDKDAMEQFNALGDFAVGFFKWMNDILTNRPGNRTIELVNQQVCKECEYEAEQKGLFGIFKGSTHDFFKMDINQVIQPSTNSKHHLTGRIFWTKLCGAHSKEKKSQTGGSVPLMNAIYDICDGSNRD